MPTDAELVESPIEDDERPTDSRHFRSSPSPRRASTSSSSTGLSIGGQAVNLRIEVQDATPLTSASPFVTDFALLSPPTDQPHTHIFTTADGEISTDLIPRPSSAPPSTTSFHPSSSFSHDPYPLPPSPGIQPVRRNSTLSARSYSGYVSPPPVGTTPGGELLPPPPPLCRPTTFWRNTRRSALTSAAYSPSTHLIRRSTFIAAGLALDAPLADISALGVDERGRRQRVVLVDQHVLPVGI